MIWNFRCSLCDLKLRDQASGDAHIAVHIKNGKVAKLKPRTEEQPDYSEAEYELHRRYGI